MKFTVCVIGSGPAGSTLAHALLEKGVPNIALIEAGGDGRLFPEAAAFHLAGDEAFSGVRQFILGGHGTHWTGMCPRLLPIDFKVQSRLGVDVDWPIDYHDLVPYYELSERLLDVHLAPEVLGQESDSRLNFIEMRLAHAARACGGWLGAYRIARNPRVFTERLLPALMKANAVRTNTTVVRLVTRGRSVSGMIVKDRAGQTEFLEAKYYALCAGGLSNARLLQLSQSEDFPTGIGNHSGHLGAHFMDHYASTYRVAGTGLRRPTYPIRQALDPSELGVYFPYQSSSPNEGPFYYYFRTDRESESIVGGIPKESVELLLSRGLIGQELEDHICENFPLVRYEVNTLMSDRPYPKNRLELDYEQRDCFGDPGLRVVLNCRADRERERDRTKQVLADAVGGRADALGVTHSDRFSSAEHPSGTTRMAQVEQDGVCDASLRVFGVDNLYVNGSSVFPTIGYANPTNTIVALSFRLADHLVALIKG